MALTKQSPYVKTSHRVSGLMLANHTSIASVRPVWYGCCSRLKLTLPLPPLSRVSQMFKRTVQQYDQFRKRNAFLDQYKKEPMFENGLDEFDSARWASLTLHSPSAPKLTFAFALQGNSHGTHRRVPGVRATRLHCTSVACIGRGEASLTLLCSQDYGAPKAEGERERARQGDE